MDWGELARVQDQIAKTEDLKRREREIQHKILYKNELEKMIQDKDKYRRTMEEQDKKLTELNFLTLVTGQITQNTDSRESPSKNRFESLLKESADYNYSLGKQKKTRLKRQLQEEKSVLRENYKKIQTEISQQKQKILQEKEKKKRELAYCYELQISSQDSKKYLQKLQNQKFQQIAHELQLKKSQQRDQHIKKIKFGYVQNPQSFQRVKHLYNQREEQKLNFIRKIENSVQKKEHNKEDDPKDLKHLKTIQTGKFNKNNYLEKQFRMRQIHNKELQAQKLNIIQIRNQLTEEQERVKVKRSLERQNLKTQLQSQIRSERQNRLKRKRMSEVQSKLNKPFFENHLSMFPGLSKDHKDLKKQLILDSFLSGMRPAPNSQRGIK